MARDTIRTLIEQVVVKPSGNQLGPIGIELHGDLFRMLEFAQEASQPASASAGSRNGNGPSLWLGAV